MTTIELPWPHRLLWPNETERWGAQHAKRGLRRNAATLGWGLTVAAGGAKLVADKVAPLLIHIEATPPLRPGPRSDEDNFKAALKHFLDGIARGLGINDRQFSFAPIVWRDKHGAGCVKISF